MSEDNRPWSTSTTATLEWRKSDLQTYIDTHPDEDNSHIEKWISQINAELLSRQHTDQAS